MKPGHKSTLTAKWIITGSVGFPGMLGTHQEGKWWRGIPREASQAGDISVAFEDVTVLHRKKEEAREKDGSQVDRQEAEQS